jgi:hypothetical protein
MRGLVLNGMLPGVGGVALLAALILSILSYWLAASSYSSFVGVGGVFLTGAGSLLFGVAAMLMLRFWRPALSVARTVAPPPASHGTGPGDADRCAVAPGPIAGPLRRPSRALGLA